MKHTKKHLTASAAVLLTAALVCAALLSCSSGVEDDGSRVPENSRVTVSSGNVGDAAKTENTAENTSAAKSEIGTRKNAAKIGDTVEYTFDSFAYGNAVVNLTLNSVVRGSEAWAAISAANMFNSEPPEGKEYVIAEFTVTNVKDLSGEDEAITVNDAQFSFSNSAFAKENQLNFVTMDGTLSAELYEGASTTGTALFVSDTDDACYAIFNDDVWFSLGE